MSDEQEEAWWEQEAQKEAEAAEREAESSFAAPSGSTAPASAYRDAEGWVLFDGNRNVIEDWPAGWPKTVNSAFLKTQGVRPVR